MCGIFFSEREKYMVGELTPVYPIPTSSKTPGKMGSLSMACSGAYTRSNKEVCLQDPSEKEKGNAKV
jgi:hypothetical protein